MHIQILYRAFLFLDNLINQFHLALNQELILSHVNYLKTALLMCIVNYTQSMSNLTGQVKFSYLPYLEKYSTIKWHGKMLTSTLSKNTKHCFVFLSPLFPFTTTLCFALREREMLAEAQYILLHTIIALPGDSATIFDILACLLWPMIHPKRDHFGKSVEVWCNQKQ